MINGIYNHLEPARWTIYETLWKLDTQRPAESIHVAKAVSGEAY